MWQLHSLKLFDKHCLTMASTSAVYRTMKYTSGSRRLQTRRRTIKPPGFLGVIETLKLFYTLTVRFHLNTLVRVHFYDVLHMITRTNTLSIETIMKYPFSIKYLAFLVISHWLIHTKRCVIFTVVKQPHANIVRVSVIWLNKPYFTIVRHTLQILCSATSIKPYRMITIFELLF